MRSSVRNVTFQQLTAEILLVNTPSPNEALAKSHKNSKQFRCHYYQMGANMTKRIYETPVVTKREKLDRIAATVPVSGEVG